MKSFCEAEAKILHKSGLELRAFQFTDHNEKIEKWSIEPFAISYFKSLTGRIHRYYIDLFIQFKNGHKFLVEIKSSIETIPPLKPKKNTTKSLINYKKALITYQTNTEKWEAAKEFANKNNMKFIIITEKQLS